MCVPPSEASFTKTGFKLDVAHGHHLLAPGSAKCPAKVSHNCLLTAGWVAGGCRRDRNTCVFGNGAGLSTQTQSQSPGLLWPLAQEGKKEVPVLGGGYIFRLGGQWWDPGLGGMGGRLEAQQSQPRGSGVCAVASTACWEACTVPAQGPAWHPFQ